MARKSPAAPLDPLLARLSEEERQEEGAEMQRRVAAGAAVGGAEGAIGARIAAGLSRKPLTRTIEADDAAERARAIAPLAQALKDLDRIEADIYTEQQKTGRASMTAMSNWAAQVAKIIVSQNQAKATLGGAKIAASDQAFLSLEERADAARPKGPGELEPRIQQSIEELGPMVESIGGVEQVRRGASPEINAKLLADLRAVPPKDRPAYVAAVQEKFPGLDVQRYFAGEATPEMIAQNPAMEGARLVLQGNEAARQAAMDVAKIRQQQAPYAEAILKTGLGQSGQMGDAVTFMIGAMKGEAPGLSMGVEGVAPGEAAGPSGSYEQFVAEFDRAATAETKAGAPQPKAGAPLSERKAWVEQATGGQWSLGEDEQVRATAPPAPAAARRVGVTATAGLTAQTRGILEEQIEKLAEGSDPESVMTRKELLASPQMQQWVKERGYEDIPDYQKIRFLFQEKRGREQRAEQQGRVLRDVNILSGGVPGATRGQVLGASLRHGMRSIFRPALLRELEEKRAGGGESSAVESAPPIEEVSPSAAITKGAETPATAAPSITEKQAAKTPPGETPEPEAETPTARPSAEPGSFTAPDPTNPKWIYRRTASGEIQIVKHPTRPNVSADKPMIVKPGAKGYDAIVGALEKQEAVMLEREEREAVAAGMREEREAVAAEEGPPPAEVPVIERAPPAPKKRGKPATEERAEERAAVQRAGGRAPEAVEAERERFAQEAEEAMRRRESRPPGAATQAALEQFVPPTAAEDVAAQREREAQEEEAFQSSLPQEEKAYMFTPSFAEEQAVSEERYEPPPPGSRPEEEVAPAPEKPSRRSKLMGELEKNVGATKQAPAAPPPAGFAAPASSDEAYRAAELRRKELEEERRRLTGR